MLMMFYALRGDLLPASRAIAVRIRSVSPKIWSWHVYLTGKHQGRERGKAEVFSVLEAFFLLLFFFFFFARSIDLSSSKPSTFHPFQMSGGLCFSHMWSQFAEEKKKNLAANCRHCLVASFEVLFSLMSPSFVIKIDAGFMRADIFWSIQKRHHHSAILLLLF